jgi:hypothetical protein
MKERLTSSRHLWFVLGTDVSLMHHLLPWSVAECHWLYAGFFGSHGSVFTSKRIAEDVENV